jgi:hypothetical protein
MRAWLLAAFVLLAGCASAPSSPPAHAKVALVNAPKLSDILPAASELPEGFHVGWEQPQGMGDHAEGLVRVLDYAHDNSTVHHSLSVGVMRFYEYASARAFFDRIRTDPLAKMQGVGDDVVVRDETFGAPAALGGGYGRTAQAYGVRGLYVVWAVEESRGEGLICDPVALVRGELARTTA